MSEDKVADGLAAALVGAVSARTESKAKTRDDEKRKSREKPTWGEDDFGVPYFHGQNVGDAYHVRFHDPFTQTLEHLRMSRVPESLTMASIHVHDDLEIARSIAVSTFGKAWREHVIEVYDRLQRRKRVFDAENAALDAEDERQFHEECRPLREAARRGPRGIKRA